MRSSLVAIPLAIGLSVGVPGSSADYTSLEADGNPLRATFNADRGKVRVLMLVAPT